MDPSPSHKRRQALREADQRNALRVLDSYPLGKYLDISQRLLDAFQKAMDGRQLDQAYVYGIRFASFGIEALPKHKDWKKGGSHTSQKKRLAKQVDKVLSMMEIIKQRMDAEEVILQEQERRRRIQEQERRQVQEAAQKAREEEERAAQKALVAVDAVKKEKTKIEQSAMAKLQAMQSKIIKTNSQQHQQQLDAKTKKQSTPKKPPTIQTTARPLPAESEQPQKRDNLSPSTKDSTVSLQTTAMATPTKTAASPDPATNGASPVPLQKTPRSSKEQATIDLLQKTIRLQEKRLEDIETKHIPALLHAAKGHLKGPESNRKAALQCVARKRGLLRQMDVIKVAIFNMETQTFMLENAMEDRQLQKALQEASQAMEKLNHSVGDANFQLENLGATLSEADGDLLVGASDETDEELMEELQEWLSPEERQQAQAAEAEHDDDDAVSILSMPTVPASPAAGLSGSLQTESEAQPQPSAVNRLLKAVLG